MPFPYHKITAEDIEALKAMTAAGRVMTGPEINPDFYHDEMPNYGTYEPEVYVEALDKYEISGIMKYANDNNIPVTVRGAGTGLAGGAATKYGGILLSVMKMNKIIELDKGNMSVTVQPGILLSELAEIVQAEGLFYPPDPGERNASIGGNVVTNAGGMKAVKYGQTKDFVRSIEAVLPDGEIVRFSSNVVKNTTGFNVKDLIIGSEGVFCIVTEVTLKLVAYPKHTATLVMAFDTNDACVDMVPKLLRMGETPVAIEFLERELVNMTEKNMDRSLPVKEGNAVLIVMYDGIDKDLLDNICMQAGELAMNEGAIDVFIADTAQREAQVWSVRAGILEAMKIESVAQEECDIVVPRSKIAEYVAKAKAICGRYGIIVEPCGHAGDGNIHTEMLRMPGMTDEEWEEGTKACMKELFALSRSLGGQLSGEHGIGNGRLEYLKPFIGDRMYALYKSIKLAFDPNLVLNPGKVVVFDDQPDAEQVLSTDY